ncbi:hypothetical protein N476_06375 [Pseudoalteromonas luteoviolacea H33]|uniref:Uncharacterized protein n=1 Tax=Pseudoalteromonas luteoviolacea H33 TaxID=1365251 RepID=A0A166ZSN5_9GAMM|nr:hypothetical protein N476_06375 [Pseudoalteromonas luteoviolacea H33]
MGSGLALLLKSFYITTGGLMYSDKFLGQQEQN